MSTDIKIPHTINILNPAINIYINTTTSALSGAI